MKQESRDLEPSTLDGDPLWYKDAVIYELHIRAFSDSNADGIGDLTGLIDKLDYLQDLGITAIWLLPFYPSPLRDGGYDIADYTSVNPCYGTRQDFSRLLKEAHNRGIRVITELVLNHTSNEHEWFQRARRAPPGSRARDYYVWSDTPVRYQDARIIFKDFETSNWSWDPVAKAYYWHRFYSHQPDLNFENPEVHAALAKVVDFWLEMGVDGLRLDAVPYLYEAEGTNCENLPETHAFLRKLRAHIDESFRGRMLLAEANQWPADAAAYFGQGDECHMNFHFPLMPRMFMALELEDSFPIINILKQTPTVDASCQWATFLRNHDELTLEMVTDEDRDYMYRVYAEEHHARINLGIRRRLAPLMKGRRRIELMNALLFSLPGTPVIYYGDEIGMGDNIYLGDRDGVRTPMQWSGDRNAGFSRCNPQKLYLPIIVDPEYHYEALNVEAQQQNPASLLWWMKRIITLRKQYRVFGRGSIEFLSPENSKVLAFVREYEGERVLVVANLSRYAQYAELDLSRFAGTAPVELFGHTRFPNIGTAPYFLSFGPYDFFWFELESPAPASIAGPAPIPRIEARGDWTSLLEEEGDEAFAPALLAHIAARRWFRSKARPAKGARIVDVIPFPLEGQGAGVSQILLVEIEYLQGTPEIYLLPVAFTTGDAAGELAARSPQGAIAWVSVRGQIEGLVHGALVNDGLATALLAAIQRGDVVSGGVGQLQATPLEALGVIAGDAPLPARLSEGDHTNSAVIYGDRLLLKISRKVEEGLNPEIEIGRFLTEQGFRGAARLAGAIEYRAPGRQPATIATLQEYVSSQGDAWQEALGALDRFYEHVLSEEAARTGAPPMPAGTLIAAARAEPPPLVVQLIGAYLVRARLLGERTAELQIALGQGGDHPAFRREPFTTLHQQSLFQSAHGLAARNFNLVRKRLPLISASASSLALAVLAHEAELDARLRRILVRRIDVARIRCHGDFHLGQVLSTGDDFIFIDFEGEPARQLTERRYKRAPMRDVAAMIRSFDYAGAAALRQGRVRPEDAATLDAWTEAWVAWVSATYLSGFLQRMGREGEAHGPEAVVPLIPRSDEDSVLLLDFYLLEKCVYELGYELNNRPDWVEIPLRGLARLLEIPPSAR